MLILSSSTCFSSSPLYCFNHSLRCFLCPFLCLFRTQAMLKEFHVIYPCCNPRRIYKIKIQCVLSFLYPHLFLHLDFSCLVRNLAYSSQFLSGKILGNPVCKRSLSGIHRAIETQSY